MELFPQKGGTLWKLFIAMLRRKNLWSGSFSGAVEMLLLAFVYYSCSTLYPDNKISYKSDSLETQCHAMVPAKVNLIYLI